MKTYFLYEVSAVLFSWMWCQLRIAHLRMREMLRLLFLVPVEGSVISPVICSIRRM